MFDTVQRRHLYLKMSIMIFTRVSHQIFIEGNVKLAELASGFAQRFGKWHCEDEMFVSVGVAPMYV